MSIGMTATKEGIGRAENFEQSLHWLGVVVWEFEPVGSRVDELLMIRSW